jgi:hypothetical protein
VSEFLSELLFPSFGVHWSDLHVLLVRQKDLMPLRCFDQIFVAHDVVTVKDGPGFVAGQSHGSFLWNTGLNQITHATAAKVMDD